MCRIVSMNGNVTASHPQQLTAVAKVLQFGRFRLDLERALLTRDGAELPLRPKCFDVLHFLAKNPGRLVGKEELLAAVWPGLVVTESSTAQCVLEIRRVLGDEGQKIIATVPRRGYRFDAEVRVVIADASPRPLIAGWRGARRETLAALAALALSVGFGLFLLGWLVGDEAGQGLARLAGESQPSRDAAQVSSVAHDYLVQGQYFQSRRADGDLKRSIGYFQKAVELDPGLGPAWVGLAGSIWLHAKTEGDVDFVAWGAEYKTALDYALKIDPKHAEAHARMANYYLEEGERERAREHFDIALKAGSDSALIHGMAAGVAYWQRDLERATELARRAVELEPLSFVNQVNYGSYLFYAGNPALARRHLEIARDLNPEGFERSEVVLLQTLVLLGDFEAVSQLAEQIQPGPARDQGLALAHDAANDVATRDSLLQSLSARESAEAALRLAEAYAYLEWPDAPEHWLEVSLERKAEEIGGPCLREFVLEAELSPLLARLPVKSGGTRRPGEMEVAQLFAKYNCPNS